MVTVFDVWRQALPAGTGLVAGRAGLERVIGWTTLLRHRQSPFDAACGGAIAFPVVAGTPVGGDQAEPVDLLLTFADAGGAAAVVAGEVGGESVAIADRMSVPLFVLPAGADPADVHLTVARFLLEGRHALLERETEIRNDLVDLAVSGSGAAAIIDRLEEITERPALLQTSDGTIRHASGLALTDEVVESQAADLRVAFAWAGSARGGVADPPVRAFPLPGTDRAQLAAPVALRGRMAGLVSVIVAGGDVLELRRVAVAAAAVACAIDGARQRAAVEARDALEVELLEALLTGDPAGVPGVRAGAERLDGGPHRDTVAFVARPQPVHGAAPTNPGQAFAGAQAWIHGRSSGALAAVRREGLVAVMPVPPGESVEQVRELAVELGRRCEDDLGGVPVSVGVGRPRHGIDGVAGSYREAAQALGLGERLLGGGHTTAYAELGLHRLLVALGARQELRAFFDEQLGALCDHDRRTGAALVATLAAYLACNGSPTEAAAALHVHRNTVLHRLRRIEEVGRLDLDDPSTRLTLHLSLKVGDVLDAEAE